jgi:hypothetical protein
MKSHAFAIMLGALALVGNPAAAQLQPQRVGQAFQRIFAGNISAAIGERNKSQHRAVVNDAPVSLLAHQRQHQTRQLVGAEQVGFQLRPQHRPTQVFHGTGLSIRAVVKQRIKASAGHFQRGGNGCANARRII